MIIRSNFKYLENLVYSKKNTSVLILEGARQILFIDEAQESDKLGSYVRFMKEKWPNTTCLLTANAKHL